MITIADFCLGIALVVVVVAAAAAVALLIPLVLFYTRLIPLVQL